MALRLAGVFPYKLNDFWNEDGLFSDVLFKKSGRVQRDLFFTKLNKFSKAPLMKEIDAVERILLVSVRAFTCMHVPSKVHWLSSLLRFTEEGMKLTYIIYI
jgi:hypothetical protein